ncbi:MAG: hypothetical protein J1G04_03280 [Clostridiales bacterium]|nr:hypothetical protein [Clostridiales bacterium]
MVIIEVLKNIEDDGAILGVERAIIREYISGGDEIVNTQSVYAARKGNAIVCIAQSYADIEDILTEFKPDDRVVLLLKHATDASALRPVSAYAYLDAMPVLPSGKFEIKRLAPTLVDAVADGAGTDRNEVEAVMRGSGVYGAIVNGKLAGFIGQCNIGGMDIYHVYDNGGYEVAKDLTRFLTTLIMTGGQIPFVLTDDVDRAAVLTACGFAKGELFAYRMGK